MLNNTREKNFRTKKKYGQNFLENKEILEQIFSYADIDEADTIIEIGQDWAFLQKHSQKKRESRDR